MRGRPLGEIGLESVSRLTLRDRASSSASRAGLVNVRNAHAFVRERLDIVDPECIAVAGTMSGARTALIYAASEPAIKACVVNQPIVDLGNRDHERFATSYRGDGVEDVPGLLRELDALRVIGRVKCPVGVVGAGNAGYANERRKLLESLELAGSRYREMPSAGDTGRLSQIVHHYNLTNRARTGWSGNFTTHAVRPSRPARSSDRATGGPATPAASDDSTSDSGSATATPAPTDLDGQGSQFLEIVHQLVEERD